MARRHWKRPSGTPSLEPRLSVFDRKVLRWALLWPVAVPLLLLPPYTLVGDIPLAQVVQGPLLLQAYVVVAAPLILSLFYPAPYVVFAGIAWWLWQETGGATPRRVAIAFAAWPLIFAAVNATLAVAVIQFEPMLPVHVAVYSLAFGYAYAGLMGLTLLIARHVAARSGMQRR